MSYNINSVSFVGQITNTPEIFELKNGNKGASFSIAMNKPYTDRQTGEKRQKTEFANVVVYNKFVAERIEAKASKGDLVAVFGEFQTSSYESDGQKRFKTEIVISQFEGQVVIEQNIG